MPSNLELIDIHKLHNLFTAKNWFKNENQEEIHKRFLNLLNNLSDEQKTLIHEIVQNYTWIPGSEYFEKFNNLMGKIDLKDLVKCNRLYLFRIVTPRDEKKTKSSDHCVYIVKGLLSAHPAYAGKEVEVIDTFDDLDKIVFKNDGSELLLLIDDFIGSGETFEECWLRALTNPTLNNSFTFIFALIIQSEAFDFIFANYGFSSIHYEKKNKGISDFYKDPEKADKAKVMEGIERIIKPSIGYNFGYRKSEALVTMIRTPDNTFPVFWKKYKIKSSEFIPPFLR